MLAQLARLVQLLEAVPSLRLDDPSADAASEIRRSFSRKSPSDAAPGRRPRPNAVHFVVAQTSDCALSGAERMAGGRLKPAPLGKVNSIGPRPLPTIAIANRETAMGHDLHPVR